jgi:hypothetical protein
MLAVHPLAVPPEYDTVPEWPEAHVHDPAVPVRPGPEHAMAVQPVATPLEYTTEPSYPAAQLHDPAVPVRPVAVHAIPAHELPLPALDHLSAGQALQPDVAPLEYTTVPSNPAAQVHDPAEPT